MRTILRQEAITVKADLDAGFCFEVAKGLLSLVESPTSLAILDSPP